MKIKILKFILWLYENHIQEDWEVYKPLLKIVVWPAWLVRAILIWILSPLYIPEYLFTKSKAYATFQATGRAPTPEEMKKIQLENKTKTQNFLNSKARSGKMIPKGKRK